MDLTLNCLSFISLSDIRQNRHIVITLFEEIAAADLLVKSAVTFVEFAVIFVESAVTFVESAVTFVESAVRFIEYSLNQYS